MPDLTWQGQTPYCTAEQMLRLVSWSIAADWAADDPDGSRPTRADLLDPDSPAGANVLSQLAAAAGEVEAACVRGGRYKPADLLALTGNARAALTSLTGWLAITGLAASKNPAAELEMPAARSARERLESLRLGETAFGTVGAVTSGAGPSATPLHADGAGGREGSGRTVGAASRFFGRRGQQGGR